MIEEFNKYVNGFDRNDINIEVKYQHSFRVMELAKKYATNLGFSKEDIELATLIGLLHDFGRFEQLRVYHTYVDSRSIDHADYSVEQLFDNNQIINFTDKKENYEIIKFAIKNHNKHHIEETNNERMLMHAKLIRDADKIDIIYLLGFLNELNQHGDDEPISKETIEAIRNHVSVDRNKAKCKNDRIAAQYAFAFDIYNDICLEDMKKYLEYYHKQIGQQKIFKEVYDEVITYIDERINNNVRNKIQS
ncbi:MAG: HD domain-containing protein [Bacilli bacterium]